MGTISQRRAVAILCQRAACVSLALLSLSTMVLAYRVRYPGTIFSSATRLAWWWVGCIPPWLYLLTLHFAAAKRQEQPVFLRSFLALIALLFPTGLGVFFADFPPGLWNMLAVGWAVAFSLFFVSLPLPHDLDGGYFSRALRILGLSIKSLMWDLWGGDVSSSPARYPLLSLRGDAHAGVSTHRVARSPEAYSIYSDVTSLAVFQETFTGCRADPPRLLQELDRRLRSDRSVLRVLDIGGADGVWTSGLLSGLIKCRCDVNYSVDCIDPADVGQQYSASVQAALGPRAYSVNFIRAGFPALPVQLSSEYDLVLASHSLYAALDTRTAGERLDLFSPLKQLIGEGGLLLAVLSAPTSHFMHVRQLLYHGLFGLSSAEDSTASWLHPALAQWRSHGFETSRLTLDNLVDVTRCLSEDQRDRLAIWLSYVLRRPLVEFSAPRVDAAREILFDKTLDAVQLPERLISELDTEVHLGGMVNVLLHKESVFFVNRVGSAVHASAV